MICNVWYEKELDEAMDKVAKRKNLDKIPATCNNKDGFVIISLPLGDVKVFLSAVNRGVVVNATGSNTCHIKETSILLDCGTVEVIKK